MTLTHDIAAIALEVDADSGCSAEVRQQRDQFARNAAWFQAHAAEVCSRHRGKCICVAGQELFVVDKAREALALATAAHPHDRGRFVHYNPKNRVPRVYAN